MPLLFLKLVPWLKSIGKILGNPKVVLVLIVLSIIGFLHQGNISKSKEITNLIKDNATYIKTIEEMDIKLGALDIIVSTQNSEVKKYKEASDKLEAKIKDLNKLVAKTQAEKLKIISEYSNAPLECEAAFDWVLDNLTVGVEQ